MTEDHYEFEFNKSADMAKVENSLLMAVIAAEGIHGRSKVNLDARFNTSLDDRRSQVNADNSVGEDIAKVFTEFLNLEIGEYSFRISKNGKYVARVPKGTFRGE
jgi:site-specific DNA-adenine methylase